MIGLLIVSHLFAVAIGAIGAGAYVGRQIRKREAAAELRGLFAKVTTVEDAARRMGV